MQALDATSIMLVQVEEIALGVCYVINTLVHQPMLG